MQNNQTLKWIMLISGLLTSSLLLAAFAPNTTLQMLFGSTIGDPLGLLLVRNWGFLIGLVGLLLIYGALRPHARQTAVFLAVSSKLFFIILFLTVGRDYLPQTAVSLLLDGVTVILLSSYLFSGRLVQKT